MAPIGTKPPRARSTRPKSAKQLRLELGRDISRAHNGRSRGNGNGNGRQNGRGNGNGNGRGNGALTKAQARRAAVRFGGTMLSAATLETARHSDDVVVVARALCDQLEIKGTQRQDLLAAAKLHDIGKAAISDRILTKPSALTASEWKRMRRHTVIGSDILASVPQLAGIAEMVRHSHERWDGQGYPDGLAGEDIPLGSRVIFCADAFHAIRADRPYRAGRSAHESLREIRRHAGAQFDPTVVEAFEQVVRDLRLAPAPPMRVRRSKRLMALLLMLAIGGGGSAVARTDLLGDPFAGSDQPASPALSCGGGSCGELLGISLAEALGGTADPPLSGDARAGVPGTILPPNGLGSPPPAPSDGGPVGTGVLHQGDPAAGGKLQLGAQGERPEAEPTPPATGGPPQGGQGGSAVTPAKPGPGGSGGSKGHGKDHGKGHGSDDGDGGRGPGRGDDDDDGDWGGQGGKGSHGSGGGPGKGNQGHGGRGPSGGAGHGSGSGGGTTGSGTGSGHGKWGKGGSGGSGSGGSGGSSGGNGPSSGGGGYGGGHGGYGGGNGGKGSSGGGGGRGGRG